MTSDIDVIARIVEQNLGVYRVAPSRLQEDVSQEAQVASDYRGRLVYELLQNADDAMADVSTTDDRVSFLVTDDELWIANTGRPLTEGDVHGLCGLGASSKVDTTGHRRASIGHKGLGFKSVLEITDEPAVYSRTHAFKLGARYARPAVDALWAELGRPPPRSVPSMRFPFAVPASDARWSDYAADGFNTAFCFPFRDSLDAESRVAVADLLMRLPLTTVLFLKHLETVEVRVEQEDRREARTWLVQRERLDETGSAWAPSTGFRGSGVYRVSVVSDDEAATFVVAHDADVAIGPNRVGLSGPAWEGVELTEVSVAALEPGSDELPLAWRRFHVFLPYVRALPLPDSRQRRVQHRPLPSARPRLAGGGRLQQPHRPRGRAARRAPNSCRSSEPGAPRPCSPRLTGVTILPVRRGRPRTSCTRRSRTSSRRSRCSRPRQGQS